MVLQLWQNLKTIAAWQAEESDQDHVSNKTHIQELAQLDEIVEWMPWSTTGA